LLVYLALKRNWVARPELAALLWPDQDSKLANTNLRKALFRLQGLPGAERIEVQPGALRFEARTDVQDFEAALREQRIADALELRHGDLLAGFDDDGNEGWSGWLQFERDRLRSAWRAAASQYLAGDLDATAAIDLAARLLEADPLDESALRLYMEWLVRARQVARARQAYNAFVARLRDELDLEPGAELRSLQDLLGATTTVAAQVPVAKAAAVDEGFVGRAVELRRIAALMAQDDCRLLCVIGPGGIGKTSLARRAMGQLSSEFADGAVFVPLDDLSAPEDLGGRIAHELDIALKGRSEPMEQLIAALEERHMLLVLDNFEQLVDGARRLEALLAACPRVKLIVTSRVRLALANEWLLPLDGLPCPEEEDQDRLEAFDAARLFVRAAHRVHPELVAAAEASAIVDICRQVEGLPLALELAASWTRVLSCEAIAAELRQGSELLHASDAARPARHASIETVFEQSWSLLGERERQALARLSVFRGGFTPQMARVVGGVPLPVLAALVDKSLLRKDGARCVLHPLVQQFAQAKLKRGGDTEASAVAHSRHFLRYVADAGHRVRNAEPEILREIDAEFENIRAAWRFAMKHGPADDLVRTAYSLMTYCEHRGRRLEGLELMQRAMESDSVAGHPKFVPTLAAHAAWMAYRLDRYAEAEALGTIALGAKALEGQRAGDTTLAFRAATVLGASCARLGRAEEAQRRFQQALDLATQSGNPFDIASALDNLGLITRGRGDLDGALRLYRLALLKHREIGDAGGEAICLNNQGVVHILRRELDAAQAVLRDARQLCERHGLPSTRVMVEVNLANVAMYSGVPEVAVRHARQALELSAQTGQRANAVEARHALVWAALRQGDLATAHSELVVAMTVAIALGRSALLVLGVRLFAELLAAQGVPEVAARVMGFVLQQPDLVGAEREEAEQQMRTWGAPSAAHEEWTGPSLDDLVHRIVAEAGQAHAPLIAELRGS
jgi:predicted ATPase/DNA-binding SARP family transcriptional activator/Flp pilus assembly protein TadD